MRIFDFVSVKLTLFLVLGILIGFYLEPKLPFVLFIQGLSLFTMGCAWKIKRLFGWTVFPAFVSLGILVTILALGKVLPHHYSHRAIEKKGLWELEVIEVLKPNPYQNRYVVHVTSFEKRKCSGKLILNLSKDSSSTPFQVDDKLAVFAAVREVRKALNPHQFDYKDYLRKKGIYHEISVVIPLKKLAHDRTSIYGFAMKNRESIIKNLSKENFGVEELGVIQALLLGKRNDISESTYSHYKNAGAMHILAVSGLHVGVLLLLLQALLKPFTSLPKGETIRLCLVVLLLWGYAFIAGLSPSVVRAVTMFTFFAYAQYLNRPTNSFNMIALSMFFILLINPLFLFQVGFQMSYAAVFFIVWIYPKLQQLWWPKYFLVRKLWQLISVSLAAQLGVLPLSLFYFHQFPGLFFISNLVIVPFLGLILSLGFLTILLSSIGYLPDLLVLVYDSIVKGMNLVVSWVASHENFVLQDIPMNGLQMALWYIVIIGSVSFTIKPKFKPILFVSIAILGLQLSALIREVDSRNLDDYLIVHSSKSSCLVHNKQKHITSYTSDSNLVKSLMAKMKTGYQMESISFRPLQNIYEIHGKRVYRVDSFGIFPPEKNLDVLWLSQSPNINLERWLDSLQPKKVIIDGSNYRSYIERWRKTCMDKKIPFHDSREKGVYLFQLE